MIRGCGDTGGDIAARLNYVTEIFLYDDLFQDIGFLLRPDSMHQGTGNKGSVATFLHPVQ